MLLNKGATFPVFARRHKGLGIPDWTFFVAKYFGSGVIIATAFIHVSSYISRAFSGFDLLIDISYSLPPTMHLQTLV